ncbi:MAG: hypothetical protein U0821_10480 [Chloroflexota bacterium]
MVMVDSRVVLLDPTQGADARRAAMTPRNLSSLEGLTVGFIDNSKGNSDVFLRMVERRLRQKWKIGEAVHIRKVSASVIAPQSELDMLAARCHAIVAGVGD